MGRSGSKKVNKAMVGQNLGNIEAKAKRGEGDSIRKRDRSSSLSSRGPTYFGSEAEMVLEAESRSSRESLFEGDAGRRSDEKLSPMAEVVKCSMEGE